MKMQLKEMQDEFNNHLVLAESIRKKYDGKAADMTGQEQLEWENHIDCADKLREKIVALQKQEQLDRWSKDISSALPMGGGGFVPDEDRTRTQEEQRKAEIRKAWARFLLDGKSSLTTAEVKAYQADNPAGGGYLVAPQDFQREIILLMKDLVFVRGMATVYTVDRAESLGIPALDTDPSDADWTAELATGNEETTMAFGKRELRPHPLAKLVKVSNKLLRQAAIDPERLIQDRLAYKFSITEEKGFLTGSGADQALGVFTASSYGIDTSRDVAAASSNAIVADDLINVKYSLKAQYQQRAVWILNRAIVKAIRKLKDQNNNYIWTTALGFPYGLGPGGGLQGTPETLLDRPVYMSEYAPGTISTGLYTAILGDFKFYAIADALDMQIQVVDQLYAATNQTGYICRREVDGMPTLAEAYARLKQP